LTPQTLKPGYWPDSLNETRTDLVAHTTCCFFDVAQNQL